MSCVAVHPQRDAGHAFLLGVLAVRIVDHAQRFPTVAAERVTGGGAGRPGRAPPHTRGMRLVSPHAFLARRGPNFPAGRAGGFRGWGLGWPNRGPSFSDALAVNPPRTAALPQCWSRAALRVHAVVPLEPAPCSLGHECRVSIRPAWHLEVTWPVS